MTILKRTLAGRTIAAAAALLSIVTGTVTPSAALSAEPLNAAASFPTLPHASPSGVSGEEAEGEQTVPGDDASRPLGQQPSGAADEGEAQEPNLQDQNAATEIPPGTSEDAGVSPETPNLEAQEVLTQSDQQVPALVLSRYRHEDFKEATPYTATEAGGGGTAFTGITSWDGGSASWGRNLLRSSTSAFTVSVTPDTGSTSTATPRVRVEFTLPASAAEGDTYLLEVQAPWAFSASALEIKDSGGRVFAVAKPQTAESRGLKHNFKLSIRLTSEVEGRSNIQGFIDVPLLAFFRSEVQNVPVVVKLDGQEAARSGDWTVPASPKEAQSMAANSTVLDNRPAITPYLRVPFSRIEAAGKWTVKLSNPSAGLSPSCNVVYTSNVVNAGGWVLQASYRPSSCTTTGTKTTTTVTAAELKKAMNLQAGDMVTIRNTWYADEPDAVYSIRITSSVWDSAGGVVATLQAKSGVPPQAEASHLALDTTKTATIQGADSSRPATLGDVVVYTIKTTPHTGNTTVITDLVTTDSLPDGVDFVSSTGGGAYDSANRTVTWGPRDLTSTGSFSDTVTVRITSAALGTKLRNVVTNYASNACGETDKTSVCSAEVETDVRSPSFSLEKKPRLEDTNNDGWLGNEGDSVVYTFELRNTGPVPIRTLLLTDPLLGVEDSECLPTGNLTSGQSTTCPGVFRHTITANDVARETISNTATVCADPAFNGLCQEATAEVGTIRPAFSFEKYVAQINGSTEEPQKQAPAIEGDEITYAFRVTNTGNTALTEATVSDPLLGITDAPCLSESEPLEPGRTATCRSESWKPYKVSRADADRGTVINTATAKVPGLPEQTDSTTTPVNPVVPTPNLPDTGSGGRAKAIAAGTALLAAGAGVFLYAHRRIEGRGEHRRPRRP